MKQNKMHEGYFTLEYARGEYSSSLTVPHASSATDSSSGDEDRQHVGTNLSDATSGQPKAGQLDVATLPMVIQQTNNLLSKLPYSIETDQALPGHDD